MVRVRFWILTYEQDVDLSYIDDLLGMVGNKKRKSEFVPSAKAFSHSYWEVNSVSTNVVSMEDAIQKLLKPLCEKADLISDLLKSAGLRTSVSTAILYDEEKFLPMMVLEEGTLNMMNTLHVSKFSIEAFLN